jgi:hypothetical protein
MQDGADVDEYRGHTICLIAMSSDLFDIDLPNPLSVPVTGRDSLSVWLSITDLPACRFWCPFVRVLDRASEYLLRATAGSDTFTGAKAADCSVFGVDLIPKAAPGRDLPADNGLTGNFVLRFGGVSLGKSGISSGRTGARGRRFGELGQNDGADEGAEFRPLLAAGRLTDVKLLMLEPRPTEGERPIDGADERDAGCRVGVDDRELERLIEGTELDDNEEARLIPGTVPEDDPGLLIVSTDEFVRLIAWVEP